MNNRVFFTTAAAWLTTLLVSQLVAVYIAFTKGALAGAGVGLTSCGAHLVVLVVLLISVFIGEARR